MANQFSTRRPITACEQAFLDHFLKVCPSARWGGGGMGRVSDHCIIETFHEALTDWKVACQWGAANPALCDELGQPHRAVKKLTYA